MLYLTCTMISSVDLAHYGISHAKDWTSVDCGTISNIVAYVMFVLVICGMCVLGEGGMLPCGGGWGLVAGDGGIKSYNYI